MPRIQHQLHEEDLHRPLDLSRSEEILDLEPAAATATAWEEPLSSGLPPYGLGRGKGFRSDEEIAAIIRENEENAVEEEEDPTTEDGWWGSEWDSSEEEFWQQDLDNLPCLNTTPLVPHISRPEDFERAIKTPQPLLPSLCLNERNNLLANNRKRYHHAIYQQQLEMWEEDARIEKGYIKRINEEWGTEEPQEGDSGETTNKKMITF